MSESLILKPDLPQITVEDILRTEGFDFSKRSPRPSMIELHKRVLVEVFESAQPIAVWNEVEVTGCSKNELHLQGGTLTSKLLAKTAGPAQKLILFAMTIGEAIDQQIAAYQQASKMSYALALDAAASTLISMGSTSALGKLEQDYHKKGLRTTFPLGPGHSYWEKLDDLQVIFSLLKPELIGMSLTESNLMFPRKSVCMVMGVGDDLPELSGKTHCDFCSLQKSCQLAMKSSGKDEEKMSR